MAYVYVHIRLDTETPFYIGIGSDCGGDYSRAHSKQSRNRYWHNVVNKTGYEVDILIDSITWEEALIKEVEYIAFYKRKEHGGILINLTDGGEGNVGYITSDEAKKKQSLKKVGKSPPNKGKKMSEAARLKNSESHKGIVSWNKGVSQPESTKQKRLDTMKEKGLFKSGEEHHNYGKSMPSYVKEALSNANKGRKPWNYGVPMSDEQKSKMNPFKKGNTPWNKGVPMLDHVKEKLKLVNTGTPAWNSGVKMTEEWKAAHPQNKELNKIIQSDLLGNIINEFDSTFDAADKTGFNLNCIRMASRNQFGRNYTNSYKGYIWSQKKPLKGGGFSRDNKLIINPYALAELMTVAIAVGV